jgi:hypothetical protein
MKPKKCRVCKAEFMPQNSTHKVCSWLCASAYAKSERIKKERREVIRQTREAKERLKSRSDWVREAQQAFNAYVRIRDAHLPCVSCGRHHEGQYHAGHYLSVGARPELRFDELNVWKQCAPCNDHLSGNVVLYRKELINRIGLDQVERLEGPHEPKKYSVDELKAIKQTYKAKAKELQRGND